MTTMMMDRPCSHCGTRMRWDSEPDQQCWKCFGSGHKGQSGPQGSSTKTTNEFVIAPSVSLGARLSRDDPAVGIQLSIIYDAKTML